MFTPQAPAGGATLPQPSWTAAQETQKPPVADRLSIVLFSGTVDKLMAMSILTTGAVAMGMDVDIFLTTWGVEAFRKDAYKTNMRVSTDFADYGSTMRELMQVKKAPTWMENLLGAREIGEVHITACSMTMDLYDLKLSDLEPIVEDITGVATFMGRAQESKMSLFI
jgi:peroxiredoxin family protein